MRLVPALALVLCAACGPRAVLGRDGRTTPTASPDAPAGVELDPPTGAHAPTIVSGADLLAPTGERPTGVVISRLPAPNRFTEPVAFTPPTPDAARALVGHRDPRTHLAFALDVAAAFTGNAIAPSTAPTDGESLVRWAQERGAWTAVTTAAGALLPGDIVVFDRALAGAPASLAAVVLGTDPRGVTDFVYVARGVVRRGFLDPARPAVARDREGHVVNTYLRHGSDYPPPGTRYLAGELTSGRVRIR